MLKAARARSCRVDVGGWPGGWLGFVPRVVDGVVYPGWAGTYYQGRVIDCLLSMAGLSVSGVPGRVIPVAQLAPFKSQDHARVFPTSQCVRVNIHERGGSA